jgi:hypothetical protein
MFIKAIETVSKYTRAIHTISRIYNSEKIIPGASTIFFVNDEGYAITCKHVATQLMHSEKITTNYTNYKIARAQLPRDENFQKKLEALKIKHKIGEGITIQMKNRFVNCVDKMSKYITYFHPNHDLAIIKFEGFSKFKCSEFAVFKKNISTVKQGKFLCRLGFPFPEFTNFKFNDKSDDIEWTHSGIMNSPIFPIDGMVTRFLGDGKGKIYGIELGRPGLRGQSGGPLFDSDGLVIGMQSRTKHLHLGFDIENKEILFNGNSKKINDYSFLHLGECIHADIIKEFLKHHKVSFEEK